MRIQKKLELPKDHIYVDLWYDENRNKANIYDDRDWFLNNIYYPNIEPFLKSIGKKIILSKFSFKNKKDVNNSNVVAIKEFYTFRAPDIVMGINGVPIITIETTDAVPTGNQPLGRLPILLKSSELKIPSILCLPLVRIRTDKTPHSNAFCNPRICLSVVTLSEKTGVPTHLFFSKDYSNYLKTGQISDKDEELIKSFTLSIGFLQRYITERTKMFFQGKFLDFTELDFKLLEISKQYYNWRKKFLRTRKILFENRIVFRQDPDRTWSERGTGCLGAWISEIVYLKIIKDKIEVWLPNLGRRFWFFRERATNRMRILNLADVIKFQNDLSIEEIVSIKDLLTEHHSGNRKRENLILGNNDDIPTRLRNSFVIFLNPEDWFEGIPKELNNLPKKTKVIFPRLVEDFWYFKQNEWIDYSKSFDTIMYQEDLTLKEFKFLEKAFKREV